jgi:hypothetical protein
MGCLIDLARLPNLPRPNFQRNPAAAVLQDIHRCACPAELRQSQ